MERADAERVGNAHPHACGEPVAGLTRTAGSEGGARKRTGRNTGTAPRSDPIPAVFVRVPPEPPGS